MTCRKCDPPDAAAYGSCLEVSVRSVTEDTVPYFPAGAGRVSAATVETAIKLKRLMDVPIMLEEEEASKT
jgi:hypothetical protein